MKIVAGDLPNKDGFNVSNGSINLLFKFWKINIGTVASVEPIGSEKNTNYGELGLGAGIGMMFAGPVGALVGGALGGIKKNQVLFRIQFVDGTMAICLGSNDEFHRVLKSSYKK